MRADVVTRVTIEGSVQSVFKYLTDLKYMHLWNPQVRKLSAKKVLALHSTYETESQILGMTITACNEVTKFVADQELQIENTTGTVGYIANFKLVPKGRRHVMVVCATTLWSDNKSFAFTKPVLKLLARRELQTDLQGLKVAVEAALPPHPLKPV